MGKDGVGFDKLPRFFEGCMEKLFDFMGNRFFHATHSGSLALICPEPWLRVQHSMRWCAAIICCAAADWYFVAANAIGTKWLRHSRSRDRKSTRLKSSHEW